MKRWKILAALAFLQGFNLYSGEFNKEAFIDNNECRNFFDALELMEKLTYEDGFKFIEYRLDGNCVLKKKSDEGLRQISRICPDGIITKTMRVVTSWFSTAHPTLLLEKKQYSAKYWKQFLPCKAYEKFKRVEAKL